MSHPASLLKMYLMDLNARLDKLDAKLDSSIQTVSEAVSKLDSKLDSGLQVTNDAVSKLDSKLDSGLQVTNDAVSKLDSKLDGGLQITNEAVSKLDAKTNDGLRTVSDAVNSVDAKLDGNVQVTNEAIGQLFIEKLSVQEFREFVDVFNKVLSESFPLPEEPVPKGSEPAVQESGTPASSGVQGEAVVVLDMETDAPGNIEAASASQASVDGSSAQIIVDSPSSEVIEKASSPEVVEEAALPLDVTVEEKVSKHVSFPMKVVGEAFYVGDGVTSIVGDVEIPPGTTVDETLVVKGNFRSRECCRLLKGVKALKDIEIGMDTTVEGTLVSGGKVTVGSNCVVKGSIESEGDVEIGDNVIVRQNLSSKSSVKVSKLAQVFHAIHAAKGVSVT